MGHLSGGVGSAAPGTDAKAVMRLEPGRYVLLSFTSGADSVPDFAKGMASELDVAGETVEGSVPDGDVKVVARDYAFEIPSSVKAGETQLRFENAGRETHEILLMELPPGVTFEQARVQMSAPLPLGTAPPPLSGGVSPLAPGGVQLVQLSLKQGSYLAICFVPNAQGVPHLGLGMLSELRVE